jgi:hypothetical protein
LIELLQVRWRHAHVAYHLGLLRLGQRRRRFVPLGAAHTQEDCFHVETGRTPAALDGRLHRIERLLVEQVQDADVVVHAAARAVLPLQGRAQLVEHGGQMPAAKDVGVV